MRQRNKLLFLPIVHQENLKSWMKDFVLVSTRGVPIDIHEPDYETRMAILKNKADLMGLMNIDEHILQFIATNIVSNVRELEGAQ